jgi:hypothetical protein
MITRTMALIKGLGVCRQFSGAERGEVFIRVSKVQNALNINFHAFAHNYFWSEGLAEMEINGLFRRKEPKNIYIRAGMESMLPEMTPTICHELVHSKQLRDMGPLKFAWFSMPVFYMSVLDREAIRVERAAENILGYSHSNGE